MNEKEITLYPCPACGFLVFEEASGSYDICSICGWEDDYVQLSNPRLRGGANRESLVEAQIEVLKTYPTEIKDAGKYMRDPKWRPITPEEAEIKRGAPETGMDYFKEAVETEPGYYWLK
jgi:uncharacterized Zn finger protein (UPF0148 family)